MKRTDYISDQRVKSMQKGAELFIQRWEDVFHRGLQTLMTHDNALEMMAEQQVDLGNGHIARQIRLAKSELSADLTPTWLDRICHSLITARALQSLDSFNLLQQIDILVQAGLRQQKKWLSAHPIQRDEFTVLSCKTESLENLFQRTTYYQRIKDGVFAEEVTYWHMSESSPKGQPIAGQRMELGYRYYPSALPLRIEIENVFSTLSQKAVVSGVPDGAAWQQRYKNILSQAPWLSRQAVVFENLIVQSIKDHPILTDPNRGSQMYFDDPYSAMVCAAFSAGQPLSIFAVAQAGQFNIRTLFRNGVAMPVEKDMIIRNVSARFQPK